MVVVSTPINHTRFAELASPLIGLTVTAPWLGDYTALYLEIGPLTDNYSHSGLPKAPYSAYFGFDWTLESRVGQEFSSTDAGAATRIVDALSGQQVTGVEVTPSWELVFALGSEQRLRSLSTDERHEWTLYLPSGSWLAVEANSLVLEAESPRLPLRT